jgi:YD repeat-containing protein
VRHLLRLRRSSGYDAVGNLLTITDPDSRYTFTYDALNRQTSADNAGTPGAAHVVLTNTFDAVGNRTRVRDQAGVTVDSSYDERNLLTSRQWSGGILNAAGLSDWVALSPEEFVALATRWAGRREELAALRAGLRDRVRKSALYDGKIFTAHLEEAYREMWLRYVGPPEQAGEVAAANPPFVG